MLVKEYKLTTNEEDDLMSSLLSGKSDKVIFINGTYTTKSSIKLLDDFMVNGVLVKANNIVINHGRTLELKGEGVIVQEPIDKMIHLKSYFDDKEDLKSVAYILMNYFKGDSYEIEKLKEGNIVLTDGNTAILKTSNGGSLKSTKYNIEELAKGDVLVLISGESHSLEVKGNSFFKIKIK